MTTLLQANTSHFFAYRDRIEQHIAKNIVYLGEKTKLRDACEYALTNGGKRYRPLIVLMVAEAIGHRLLVDEAALSVEFFHTASLIADDLPCMDDEEERRQKPTTHKVFGESVALLASYALITAAFGKIAKAGQRLREAGPPFSATSDRVVALALHYASEAAGILGATSGQFLDLFPPQYTIDTVKQVILKKTVTLFEISFLFGWLFGGGELGRVEKVKRIAGHFGMAFQIADDLRDLPEDLKKEKTMNMARFLGKERAANLFTEEMSFFEKGLKDLNLYTPSFEKMCGMLYQYAKC